MNYILQNTLVLYWTIRKEGWPNIEGTPCIHNIPFLLILDTKPQNYQLISVPDSYEYAQVREQSILSLKESNFTISPCATGQISTYK